MGEYSNMLARLPAITIESGNDDIWVGVLEYVAKIDHIDYTLKYRWVFMLPANKNQKVEYREHFVVVQSYNHLDDMLVGYKKNNKVERICIQRIFEY